MLRSQQWGRQDLSSIIGIARCIVWLGALNCMNCCCQSCLLVVFVSFLCEQRSDALPDCTIFAPSPWWTIGWILWWGGRGWPAVWLNAHSLPLACNINLYMNMNDSLGHPGRCQGQGRSSECQGNFLTCCRNGFQKQKRMIWWMSSAWPAAFLSVPHKPFGSGLVLHLVSGAELRTVPWKLNPRLCLFAVNFLLSFDAGHPEGSQLIIPCFWLRRR